MLIVGVVWIVGMFIVTLAFGPPVRFPYLDDVLELYGAFIAYLPGVPVVWLVGKTDPLDPSAT